MFNFSRSYFAPLGVALTVSTALVAGCGNPATPTATPGDLGAPAGTAGSAHYTALSTPTAAASHTNGSFSAARAIDGNTDTEWQSGKVANPSLTLTLPASGELLELAVKVNPTAGTYAIEVSEDGTTFTPALSGQKNTTWGVETKKFPAGTKGRLVRLSFTNNNANVMVFEATVKQGAIATPAPSVAPTAAPTAAPVASAPSAAASNTNGSYAAARAIDGNQGTEWQSGAVSNPTLTIDRGQLASLTGLSLKTNPNFGTYTVEVSDDGATYRALLTGQKNTTWGMETKAVPAGTTGRFVRFKFANTGKNVMVFEVATPGTAVSGTTPSASPTTAPTAAPSAAPTPVVSTAPSTSVRTRFGNQSVPKVGNSYDQGFALINDLGMNTIREGWNWKYIEVNKNQYVSWMNMFDDKMTRFVTNGVKAHALICDTPDWASSDAKYNWKTTFDAASLGKYTVPAGLNQPMFSDGTDVYKPGVKPNPNNYYAEYIFELATRYKGKIGYYQIWNEPDFPSGDLTAGATDANGRTRYWTGSVQDYVRLLKVSHTMIKNIDPAAKVTLGGIGYEKYLAAIIDNGGAPYFDIVDFHAYGTDKTSSNGVLNSAWGFFGRYNALKAVLQQKGVTGKTFTVTETGFTANNQSEQASYVAKVFSAGAAQGDIEAIDWAVFTNPGFSNIGIIDQASLSVKTQGYHAFKFATSQLTGATPQGALSGTGVQGFKFQRKDGKPLFVVWSTTASASTTLPISGGQVLDKFGKVKSSSFNGTLSLTPDPVYVVGN